MQRMFAEMLVDVLGAVGGLDSGRMVRVSSLQLDLPLEVSLAAGKTELQFAADVPRWRWSTVFDKPCGRLLLVCDFGGDG